MNAFDIIAALMINKPLSKAESDARDERYDEERTVALSRGEARVCAAHEKRMRKGARRLALAAARTK